MNTGTLIDYNDGTQRECTEAEALEMMTESAIVGYGGIGKDGKAHYQLAYSFIEHLEYISHDNWKVRRARGLS